MASPAVIELIIQKGTSDCCVACLAMLLGQPYKDVYRAAVDLKYVVQEGMTNRQMIRVAKTFGVGMTALPIPSLHPFEPPFSTGIFSFYNHAVVLFEGVVVDPSDGLLYDVDAYIATQKRIKPARLLII